ncbi:uncharacterized protein CcaverHIS019_0502880 [Cutaneotrichosporon cavernicola]|uniref:Uncharacterized protein n=1 Tax=Cutaneotrichosporon cavernicola TaxID=279322 RepID=A0AA48L670_9TREE|nr:uncharacterized protein CcaverHIS019_0502880 [Cutaneotrichosporon cavernicola]BEI92660.1 hypothetical protein CcaverHIS019_0502880 [Cutaneotrichosporon cavernicola]BEJ00435.1 hypothetical protein CcaverHIS631_0502920 [Cutaneotrichosporon cavernicola]
MDANNLDGQVNDLVRNLAASETDTLDDAITANFAADAQLTTSINSVKGADNIRDVLNLHHAFASECTPGPVNWDENNKTATFSLQSIYSLGNAPWPFSMLRRFSVPVKWADIKLYLQPDESQPVRSDATEPTKYQVSRISTVAHPPQNKLIAAAYSVLMYTARIVAPYLIDTMVVLHKFFVRNPLERGVIRTGASGVVEILSWVLRAASSRVPLIGNKKVRRPRLLEDPERVPANVDVPSSPPVPDEPLPVRKSSKRTSMRESVQEPVQSVQELVNDNTPELALDEEQITRDNAAATAEAVVDHDEADIDQQEQAEEVKETATLDSEVQKVEAPAEPEAEQVTAKIEDEEKVKEDAAAETTLETTMAAEEKAEEAEETKEAKALEEEVAEVQASAEPEPKTKPVDNEPETEAEDAKPEEPAPVVADIATPQPADHTTTDIKEDISAISETKDTAEDAETKPDDLADTVVTDVDTLEEPVLNPELSSTEDHVPEVATSGQVAKPDETDLESKTEDAEPASIAAKITNQQIVDDTTSETKVDVPATSAAKDAEETDAETKADVLAETVETDVDTLEEPVLNPELASTPVSVPADEAEPEATEPKEAEAKGTEAQKPVEAAIAVPAAEEEAMPEAVHAEEAKPEEAEVAEPKVEETKPQEVTVEEPKIEEVAVEETKIEEVAVEEPKPQEVALEEPRVEETKTEEHVHASFADMAANQPAHHTTTETAEDFPALPTGDNAAEEPNSTAAATISLPDSGPSFADIASSRTENDDSESRSSSLPGTAEGSVDGDKKKKKKNKKKSNKNKNKNRRLRNKEIPSNAGGNE